MRQQDKQVRFSLAGNPFCTFAAYAVLDFATGLPQSCLVMAFTVLECILL